LNLFSETAQNNLRFLGFRMRDLVTQKFGDHELEDVALVWDAKTATAAELL
jgi:hypothetical protein